MLEPTYQFAAPLLMALSSTVFKSFILAFKQKRRLWLALLRWASVPDALMLGSKWNIERIECKKGQELQCQIRKQGVIHQSNTIIMTEIKRSDPLTLFVRIFKMGRFWRKRVRKSRHRMKILEEWATTQQSYINDLRLIQDKIQKPLLAQLLITAEEDRIVFPNLEGMVKLSTQLLKVIKSFIADFHPNRTAIGESLINFHKYFIIYRDYCNNFYKAQQIIKQVKEKPACEPIIKSLSMDIESYIIKPVQRPPKYQLLIREYLKDLLRHHRDFEPLKKAAAKYHDVNEENNQSMDLQIRNQKMVELDQKYGGVINTTRVFLFEESALTLDMELKVYVFNDLVLLTRCLGQDREEGYKKIFLDGHSFVDAPKDGKYLQNKLFICGIKENIHIMFKTAEARCKVYQKLEQILRELYRKETNWSLVKKKSKSKMNVMTPMTLKTRPNLRVTVVGVEKRPNSAMNLTFDTFYIIKLQAPNPVETFQYSYMKFDDLIAIEKEMRSKNKLMALPSMDDKPEDMSLYDVKKNKTRIIECRLMYIERFINYVCRFIEEDIYAEWLMKSLEINEDFWKFVNYSEPCSCEVCFAEDQQSSIVSYELQMQNIKTSLGSFLTNLSRSSFESFTQSRLLTKPSAPVCIFNSFTMGTKIVKAQGWELDTLNRRLLWLECKLGRIDYSLVSKPEPVNVIKVSINLLSLKGDQNVNVRLCKGTTVLQVIDQIAEIYQIENMRDFGLFLDYQGFPRLLDRDQKLWQILQDVQYEFVEAVGASEGSAFWSKLNAIKKWGEQIINGKPSKLYIRKYLYMSEELQLSACEHNPERYSLLVGQAFYRFKNQLLMLQTNDVKRICALYYILTYMDKVAHLTELNFQAEKLKHLLPESLWVLLAEHSGFESDVYQIIKSYEAMMENWSMPADRKSKTLSVFSKVELIYAQVVKLVSRVLGWNTMFFSVTNYEPATLPGSSPSLLLGVSPTKLFLTKEKQMSPLLQFDLRSLCYKVTVFSIFIESAEGRTYRFDGHLMHGVKQIIEIYKLLDEKFSSSSTV